LIVCLFSLKTAKGCLFGASVLTVGHKQFQTAYSKVLDQVFSQKSFIFILLLSFKKKFKKKNSLQKGAGVGFDPLTSCSKTQHNTSLPT
ncbi:hypothetical protein, partial [Salmonella enterica]|uniref:hypothetical protein n=1 Tax=Salmonella enterica TaxID=28901 RepID=UPI0020C3F716